MRIFGLMVTGSWIGFGYSLGTGNRVGEITFPIISVIISIVATAFEMLQPIELERAGWDD
jgi:hypothetical protein